MTRSETVFLDAQRRLATQLQVIADQAKNDGKYDAAIEAVVQMSRILSAIMQMETILESTRDARTTPPPLAS